MADRLSGLLAALVFASLVLGLGLLLIGWVRRRRLEAPVWSAAELLVASALCGIGAATLLGLLLAYAGLFGAWTLSALLALCVGVVAPRAWPTIRGMTVRAPRRFELVAIVLALGVMGFCVARRFHEVEGLRDPGVYVASGIELARTGDFGWNDPLAAEHGFAKVSHLFQDWGDFHEGKPRWERFAGFYVDQPSTGHVQPQFLHGYEIWIALAYLFGGPQATQCVNALFVFLALLALFCALRETLSSAVAGFGVLLVAACPVELWFARFPSNEMMVQALLWGGVFLYARALAGRDSEHGRVEQTGWEIALGLMLVAVAALTKIAAWGLLAVFALEVGMASAQGRLKASSWRLWLVLMASAVLAYLHARLFAHFYLYGSWAFTAKRLGVAFWFLPVLYVGGVAAAFSLGQLLGWLLPQLPVRLDRRRWRLAPYAAGTFGVWGIFAFQLWVYRSESSQVNVWKERTNLAEFAFYFSYPLFLAGVAGLAWMFLRLRSQAKSLLLWLLAFSALFIVRRNLDAIHPWAARRWMPFLVPLFCTAIAYPAAVLWEKRKPVARGAALVWGFGAALLLVCSTPQLVKARNFHGLIPQLDKLAERLYPQDLLLMHPTSSVVQLGPYLKARFGMDAYTQPCSAEGWRLTLPLAKAAAAKGRRVLYLSDQPLSDSLAERPFLCEAGEFVLEHSELLDGYRRLEKEPVHSVSRLRLYEIRPEAFPRGWWPDWKPTAARRELTTLPLTLKMDAAAAPYIERFHDPTPAGEGRFYRWSDGNGRIRIGELLKFPLDKSRVRLSLRMHSGRPEGYTTVTAHFYLDLDKKQRAVELGKKVLSPEWSETQIEVEASRVHEDSVLEIQSLRPPVGKAFGWGKLGVMVEELRME